MSLALNKPKLDNLAGDIWKSAERLRGKFKAYEYQGVILPIIVIRRLECVLLAWREAKRAEVLAKRPRLTDKELAQLVKELELNLQQSPFSNKTKWTLRKVYEEDHTLLEENFRAYINGFSKNVDDIIEHFNYRATIGTMVKNNRLAPILNQYKELELGPDQLSGLEMGYIYEEILRRFSEQSGEEAGEHFTPREVIRLMVELLEIPIPERHVSIYDPACGTGGMLSVAKEHLLDRAATPAQRNNVEKFVTVHGHVRHYANRKQEHFLCASINGANEILNIRVVSIGLIDRTPVHPREVFADALSDRASAIIVAHNHPTGSLEPSATDVEVTGQLKSAGSVVGIALLDHIIFNQKGYYSFLENGLM